MRKYYSEGSLTDPVGVTVGWDESFTDHEGNEVTNRVAKRPYFRHELSDEQAELINRAIAISGPHRGLVGLVDPERGPALIKAQNEILARGEALPEVKGSSLEMILSVAKKVVDDSTG